jgi:hypothetical protein
MGDELLAASIFSGRESRSTFSSLSFPSQAGGKAPLLILAKLISLSW